MVLGAALLVYAGSALVVEPPPGRDPRDPLLPGLLGGTALALGTVRLLAAFQPRDERA